MTGNANAAGKADTRTSHRRTPIVPLADADLIARYRRVLRLELADTLAELRPAAEAGLFGPNEKRPALATRRQLVDMARTLVAALSSPYELEPEPPEELAPAARRRTGRVRIDYG